MGAGKRGNETAGKRTVLFTLGIVLHLDFGRGPVSVPAAQHCFAQVIFLALVRNARPVECSAIGNQTAETPFADKLLLRKEKCRK